MVVVQRVDQLNIDQHTVAFAPDAALEDICHPKCATDLAQITGRATVAHDRRPTDDFQVGDLCQTRQDIV